MGEGCVCVPLSFISFFPQDESEDVEASDDNEEAEEEEGRANGMKSSMRTPLAVTNQFHGCVSVMLCLFKGRCINQFCGDA